MRTLSIIRRSAIGAASTWLLAACGGGGDVAAPPPTAPRLEIASIVVEDPQTGDIMFSHADHWHGFPTVAAGGAPLSGGVQAITRSTPATLAVRTLIWAEATIGNLPPGT